MFNFNLRSATALLTIISILGPNSVYAMESDAIEVFEPLPLSRSLPKTPLPEQENEVQSPPSPLSSSIPPAPQEQPEGLFSRTLSTIYSYTLAPMSQFLTDYVKSGLSEGVVGACTFINGVDLYPIMKQTVPAMQQAGQDAVEYWNQPSAEYPAAMKNVMEGFAQEMGPNLHHLLINANNILGQEYAASIVQRMGLAQKAGTMVGNNLMQLTNPLGWGTTLITLTKMGFNFADLKKDGLLGLAKREITKIAARKAGLPENYMNLQQEDLKTEQVYFEEYDKWGQYERAHQADESYNAYSYPRNKEYRDAMQASIKAKADLDKATSAYAKEDTGGLKMLAYNVWRRGLENTLRKTLTSFANDLESKVTTFQYIPETAVPLVKDTLRAFILGDESSLKPVIEQGKELVSDAKEFTDAVNTVTRKPMEVLKNMSPEVIANAANDLSNVFNAGLGHVAGSAASKFTKEMIRDLNLKKINMFQRRELNLDINDLIQNLQLPDILKTSLDHANGFFDFDELAQRLLQNVGKQAAVHFSNILGNFVLEEVNAASSKQYISSKQYTLEELLTQEIDNSFTTRSYDYFKSRFKIN